MGWKKQRERVVYTSCGRKLLTLKDEDSCRVTIKPTGHDTVHAIGFRPITDNKKVLHHWILYEQTGGAFITGWAPGAEDAAPLPNDVGMYIAKGKQSLRLDMHYYNK